MPSEVAESREQLLHSLYEAAELEHNLMCTYLYAAYSLKTTQAEGLSSDELEPVTRWRDTIERVAVQEMAHLAAVWNITSALAGAPRIGRGNFPLDPGYLPAEIVVKLAPFNEDTLQHFVYLERPHGSLEAEGKGFAHQRRFGRGNPAAHLTPMSQDYETVGTFYECIKAELTRLAERVGEREAFRGDPALQLSGAEIGLSDVKPVICLKTALAAFDSIVRQGEGSPIDASDSHFQKFLGIREELRKIRDRNPNFSPAFPAATNPVLRQPPNPEGRVWLEDSRAIATVDLANASYGLMLRLLAYSYVLPAERKSEKAAVLQWAIALMRALTLLGEQAARLPAGPSNQNCNAGVSFTALRDAAALPVGPSSVAFFVERLAEFDQAARQLAASGLPRHLRAAESLGNLARMAAQRYPSQAPAAGAANLATSDRSQSSPIPNRETAPPGPAETVRSGNLELRFEGKRCIHARFCVTGAPAVFLANVKGPWIHPEAMALERVVEVAHACPSGAIQYTRFDGAPNEVAPPVNLASVREAGPYAFRGELRIAGEPAGFRATLCRCGASKNKPYCDGSHHQVLFSATGEPPTTSSTDMLSVRNGPLEVNPQPNGPLQITGSLEIISGTGRVVARLESARLCRCGGSQSKPFCDGTHAKIGFRSESA